MLKRAFVALYNYCTILFLIFFQTRHATNVPLPDRIPQSASKIYNDGSQVMNNSVQSKSHFHSMSQPHLQSPQQAYFPNSMSMQMGYGQQPMYQVSTPLLSVGYEYQPNYPYYGGGGGGPRLLPQPSFAKVANNEHDKKLLSLIERQTEVIGHLNTKIMQQENQKIQRDKKELRSRLKQLEMANALKQRELEYRVQNTLLTNSPKLPRMSQFQQPQQEEVEKKKGSDRILSVLGKFVLATEMADSQKSKSRNKRKYGSFLQAAFQGLKGSQDEKGLSAADRTFTENDQLYYSNTKGNDNGESPLSRNSNNDDDDNDDDI